MPKGKHRNKVQRHAQQYWEMYRSFDDTYCPVLDRKIKFSRLGWDHLLTIKKRTRRERFSRIALLQYARKVISTATEIESRNIKDQFEYVRLVEVVNDKRLAVVLTRKKRKEAEFSFFSIYQI